MNPNTKESKISYCPKQMFEMRRLYRNKYVETLFRLSFTCIPNYITTLRVP